MLHYKRLLKDGAQTRGVITHVYVSRHSATGGNARPRGCVGMKG
jgi:hypothetical protein